MLLLPWCPQVFPQPTTHGRMLSFFLPFAQVCAYLLAATRALALGRVDMVQRIALFCAAPTAAQLLFMLCAPATYQRHRVAASYLCRLPMDGWLVLWQEGSSRGLDAPPAGEGHQSRVRGGGWLGGWVAGWQREV